MLPLIESGRTGLDIDALSADVIAADARFNKWVLEQKRASGDWNETIEANWSRMLDLYEEAALECNAAVQKFRDGGERGELVDALRLVAEKLNRRPDLTGPPS